MIDKIFRTEICGNIASGKTTLAPIIGRSCNIILENFLDNPFYVEFYKNPFLNSFETELTFHLQHYHSIKNIEMTSNIPLICDFSLILDRAYADVTLSGKRLSLFTQLSEELEEEIDPPTKIIRLNCPEEVLLKRIIARNREPEKSITLGYLKSLTSAIDNRIDALASSQPNIEIVNIDSNQYDFANDPKSQEAVLKIIQGV